MAEFTGLVLASWQAALKAGGDGEGATSILASALAFAASDAGLPIDEVLSRVKDDHATAEIAKPNSS